MSRTKAINDYCKMCIYDPLVAGTYREQIQNCSSEKSCPLWPYRPVSVAMINANRKIKLDTAAVDALTDGLEDDEES
jgi:hypothetical protein